MNNGYCREPNPGLVCRNVVVAGKRTSLRLECIYWEGLNDISAELSLKRDAVATRIDGCRGPVGMTSAVRVFVAGYFLARARDPLATANALYAAALHEVEQALVKALTPKRVPRDQLTVIRRRLRRQMAALMTKERAVAISQLTRSDSDLFRVASQIRALWGGKADWSEKEDLIAAQVAIDLAREWVERHAVQPQGKPLPATETSRKSGIMPAATRSRRAPAPAAIAS
ncbi:ribbon-helix-helix domain-containing protein [Azospirillum sp. sgz302134]